MGQNKWMAYVTYVVLVIGAGATLMLAEKPLSSTVVSLALMSFNLAALMFVAPGVMNFMTQMRQTQQENNEEITLQLKEIKARIAILTNATARGKALPLKNALAGTAASTPLKAEEIKDMPMPAAQAPSSESPLGTASSAYATAALQSVKNAAPMPSTGSSNPSSSTVGSFDGIFGTRAQVLPRPAIPPTPPAKPVQPQLFTPPPANTPAPTAAAVASVAAQGATLIVNARVQEDDVLCLRGEGPGLNWQEGQPMSYVGNDEWRWNVSSLTNPATVRIYLNDDVSAFGDDIVLAPGQTLQVSPSFPQVEGQ